MRRRFSENEKLLILDRDSGTSVCEICKKHGIHRRTFYKWLDEVNAAADEEHPQATAQKQQNRTAADQKLLAAVKTRLPRASPFEIAKHLIEVISLPVARACRIAGISRRTWYRWRRIKYVTVGTPELGAYCRTLVLRAAKKWNLPPAYITAHIRGRLADNARKEVMRDMIVRLGLSRSMVAGMFHRDLRRVRKSELGG